jgi:hypothetical protein
MIIYVSQLYNKKYLNMSVITFSKYYGPEGIEQFIINKTSCKPYSGEGINIREEKKTAILKSIDNTYFYDDDLSDINNVKYTLFGHNGDQNENQKKYNEPLLNINKIQHIYLHRVRKNGKKTEYIWYGKYKIVDKNTKSHIGKDYIMRNIIILSLKKIDT